MQNRKHYIVIENTEARWSYDKYLIVPEGEEVDPNKYYSRYATLEEAQETADERNNKYYTSDYSEEEIKEFFDSVDFTALEEALNKKLGLKLTYNHSLKDGRSGYSINFKSNENLSELPEAGLLARMLPECHLENFSTCLKANSETGELYIWIGVHFTYSHWDLGSNGCNFADAHYTAKEGWKVTFEQDQYEKRKRYID